MLLPLRGTRSAADAAQLLRHFGSLRATLFASATEIARATRGDAELTAYLTLVRQTMRWTLRQHLDDRPLIADHAALTDYLRFAQGAEAVEIFRILYLDTGNRLIREEIVSRGTVDEARVYVREIIRRALELGATRLILVHNHPSGLAAPSIGDKAVTRRIAEAGRGFDIHVLEHLIVTTGGFFSFRAEGLL